MMRGLVGRKIGMTRIFDARGDAIPVTLLEAGPCVVTQIKTNTTDGYEAIQVGYKDRKEKHTNKPLQGHFDKALVSPKAILAEFQKVPSFDYKNGQVFDSNLFKIGEYVKITGNSKGHGFSGVIKRHNFSLQRKTHGMGDTARHGGSVGAASYPSRVFPGKKMPGHYGNVKVTIKNLQIVKIDYEKNQLFVKGSVPGPNNAIITIHR